MDFQGYDIILTNELNEETECILEGRIPLVSYTIKKNDSKWTIKNNSTNQRYFLKVDEIHPEKNIHDFLHSIEAYENRIQPKTHNNIVDYNTLTKDIFLSGAATIWIKADKEPIIKSTYCYTQPKKEIGLMDTETGAPMMQYNISEDTGAGAVGGVSSGDISRVGGTLGLTQRQAQDIASGKVENTVKPKKRRKIKRIIEFEEEE